MRGRATRSAIAASSALLAVIGIAGCNQQSPSNGGGNSAQGDLKIVEQVQIDQNGAEVKPDAGATPADPAGDGKATCPPVSIAMAGALNGPDAALGINIKDGVQLAIDKHNAANPGCQVQLKPFDTEGDPQKATAIAPQIVDDAFTIGLVGPAFSGETKATGGVFDQAGLVAATASATNVTLSEQGWKTFFRGLANDGVQGPSVANYLKNTLQQKKVCVVDDSTDYGTGLAAAVRETLGPVALDACKISVKKGDKDFSAAVTQVKGQSPDSVFYSGYYAEAAPFVQQLRDGGYTGKFVSADGTKDPEFVKAAGQASKDAILSCPCGPATGSFADEYTKKFGQAPGTYSTEGYDLGTVLLKGIDAGKITRPDLLDWVKNYNGQGVARKYQWTDKGELTTTLIWIYKVQ
ncbi:branched-chain amino acid ABC transporter substrate-binding protein [Mycolicibacterium aichiense]|uniref:Branched chain amino acid ABC transporter substrate-binding protein n=1 Tax=Mycolicibacterium aichiense TaxID=1799 RepID=A0AAD1HP81_9MYCO|nr:branched-chain amino acid ABC transporter substrate-binding protein [Mycolicibacterium aichiense]MCV7019049.1 branched-chain amino acid ABC transporter substrate-binding protein [Mycolicibacterium aichiense]BBX08405.1 branched chain amino acid ABC transporter substrate-binding protein [Mycolicibacterium aichiense]STZ82205.1 amino acid/amide ABC transporter substrate-binding protein, HAAT family [Mycolicibacterium aichiense]